MLNSMVELKISYKNKMYVYTCIFSNLVKKLKENWTMKTVKHITKAFKINMGGVILDQALPYRGQEQIDPFLLIHHWGDTLKGGKQQRDVGVGPHPHRGFSPVTFIFKGGVHHRDSLGTSEVVYAGGTQWMNSGKGIIHSERPTKELAEAGGDFELIQFWINAPAKNKLDQPKYQPLNKEDTPLIVSDEGKVHTYVVAGELEGEKGLIEAYSDVLILRFDIKANGKKKVAVPKAFNTLIYHLDGKLKVNNDALVEDKTMIQFNNDGDFIEIEAQSDSRLILLSGLPINEP